MNWRHYQNELIVLAAFFIMLVTYVYKYNQVASQAEDTKTVQHSIAELKEVLALKKVWADKKIGKKVEKLQVLIPLAKVKWSRKSKKITATYTGLTSNELNKLISKILNLPIAITLLEVKKTGSNYNVEFKCKW